MEQKQPIGFLFERIAYFSDESIEGFIDSLDEKSLYYVLSQVLEYSHSKNIYTLLESEIISKTLRILNKEMNKYDTTGFNTDNVENNQFGE
jgi:hypothetical protein